MCVAREIRQKNYFDNQAMFRDSLKNKLKLYRVENERSRYYSIVFSDNSRLTFKLCEDDFSLISWHYR